MYGHGSHLGQWTATVLAIFRSPVPNRLYLKFEQHWPRASESFEILNIFPIQMYESIEMLKDANLTAP